MSTPDEQLEEVRGRADRALRAVGHLVGSSAPRVSHGDVSSLQRAIDEALHTLTSWAGTDPAKAGASADLVSELSLLRISLQGHEVVRRRESVGRLHASLQRLQQATSLQQLADAIPVEVASLGFHRVLFSWIDQSRWIPEGFHTVNGPVEARAVMEAGSPPYWHVGRVLEREMIEHRLPMLVHNVLDNPRVHHQLLSVTQSTSYVAAPVVQRSKVVAFLHADQNVQTGDVDEVDRDVVHLFAEGVSLALDRVSALEELAAVRARIGAQAAAISDMVAALGSSSPPGQPGEGQRAAAPEQQLSVSSRWADVLTRREEQVLEHVAAGLTNAQIATRMYITEGTTKTHVRNVLRKLGADNRAHAVAIFHGTA